MRIGKWNWNFLTMHIKVKHLNKIQYFWHLRRVVPKTLLEEMEVWKRNRKRSRRKLKLIYFQIKFLLSLNISWVRRKSRLMKLRDRKSLEWYSWNESFHGTSSRRNCFVVLLNMGRNTKKDNLDCEMTISTIIPRDGRVKMKKGKRKVCILLKKNWRSFNKEEEDPRRGA